MLSEQIAEYYASFKIRPDANSVRKLDQWLRVIETKIQRTGRKLEKQDIMGGLFKVDNAKLAQQLNKSLEQASNRAVFNIRNFRIDQTALNSALQSAAARAATITINPKVGKIPTTGQPSPNQSTGLNRPVQNAARNTRSLGMAWHGALAGGGILSGFGLRALNTTLQELQMQPVALESVTGSKDTARQQLDFINRLGNEVGATRRELAPDYTKFLASAQGTALEPFAQSGFRSLTRYGKVMGLDQEAMKGTFRAISQVVSKQQIMAEELKGQLI